MSHCITRHDRVLTPQGNKFNTWHGLDIKVKDTIKKTDCEIHGIHPKITLEQLKFQNVSGEVPVKAVTAHTEQGGLFLGTASERYEIIPNGQVWDLMERSLESVSSFNPIVSCVGTLDALKKYFISVQLNKGESLEIGGENYFANLNFITSHDGTTALKVYDSVVRIVCMNTFNASLAEKGGLSFSVRHKGDSKDKVLNLEETLKSIFAERKQFSKAMEKMQSIELSEGAQIKMTGGYFVKDNIDLKDTSVRIQNSVRGIVALAKNGKGNNGRTMHDVFQGATDYWTNGDGVGRRTSIAKKVSSSEFGTAAAHKARFYKYLTNTKPFLNA